MQTQPGQFPTPPASDIPEDVRAELDTEERRQRGESVSPVAPAELPEDVLGERDLEARRASGEIERVQVQGGPAVENEQPAS